MKAWSLAPAARGRFADQGGLGPFLEDDQRVAEVDTTLVGQPDQAEQRRFDLDALGDIKQCPAGPERRVQGGEEIVGGLHGLGQQIPANQVGMILDGLVQVEEDRPAQATGIGQADSRPVDVLDAGRVVGAQAFPQSVKCRAGLAVGLVGARGCEVLQLEGHGYRFAATPRRGRSARRRPGTGRRPPAGGRSARLVRRGRERNGLKGRFGESAGRSRRRGALVIMSRQDVRHGNRMPIVGIELDPRVGRESVAGPEIADLCRQVSDCHARILGRIDGIDAMQSLKAHPSPRTRQTLQSGCQASFGLLSPPTLPSGAGSACSSRRRIPWAVP